MQPRRALLCGQRCSTSRPRLHTQAVRARSKCPAGHARGPPPPPPPPDRERREMPGSGDRDPGTGDFTPVPPSLSGDGSRLQQRLAPVLSRTLWTRAGRPSEPHDRECFSHRRRAVKERGARRLLAGTRFQRQCDAPCPSIHQTRKHAHPVDVPLRGGRAARASPPLARYRPPSFHPSTHTRRPQTPASGRRTHRASPRSPSA